MIYLLIYWKINYHYSSTKLHLLPQPRCSFYQDLVSTGCKGSQVRQTLKGTFRYQNTETNLPAAPTEQAALEERKIVTLPIGLEDFLSVGHYQPGQKR